MSVVGSPYELDPPEAVGWPYGLDPLEVVGWTCGLGLFGGVCGLGASPTGSGTAEPGALL